VAFDRIKTNTIAFGGFSEFNIATPGASKFNISLVTVTNSVFESPDSLLVTQKFAYTGKA